MEVPRFERLLLSLLAVERRPRVLNIWHDIESKLGGFMRGQGLAMLAIGAASAIGYAVIGLGVVLQVTENNVLIPRIMYRAVGVSALVGLLAVLAFGTLYGVLGIL